MQCFIEDFFLGEGGMDRCMQSVHEQSTNHIANRLLCKVIHYMSVDLHEILEMFKDKKHQIQL